MGYIQGVPEVMQISAFMRNSKCPELARRFADQVPQTVTEMMKRVDDFVKSEEAFKSTELPKGEQSKKGTNRDERTSCCLVNHTYDYEVPNTKRNCNVGSGKGCNIRG
nr:reverse transcriptase domain-containing protein [Tanacetum cinerariifolium]